MKQFRPIAWTVGLAIAGLLLVGCTPPLMVTPEAGGGAAVSPTDPTPATVETPAEPVAASPATEYALSIVARQSSVAATDISDQRIFPLREITYTASADSLVDLPVNGVPVLALGRIISGTAAAITSTETITWVLFSAVGTPAWQTQWLQTRTETLAGQRHTLGIEHTIAADHIVALPCCESGEEAFFALLDARDAWGEDRGVSIWLESVLVRAADAQGAETWTLWTFHNDPGGGAGGAGRQTFCTLYLRCTTATDRWATWVCGWYCQ